MNKENKAEKDYTFEGVFTLENREEEFTSRVQPVWNFKSVETAWKHNYNVVQVRTDLIKKVIKGDDPKYADYPHDLTFLADLNKNLNKLAELNKSVYVNKYKLIVFVEKHCECYETGSFYMDSAGFLKPLYLTKHYGIAERYSPRTIKALTNKMLELYPDKRTVQIDVDNYLLDKALESIKNNKNDDKYTSDSRAKLLEEDTKDVENEPTKGSSLLAKLRSLQNLVSHTADTSGIYYIMSEGCSYDEDSITNLVTKNYLESSGYRASEFVSITRETSRIEEDIKITIEFVSEEPNKSARWGIYHKLQEIMKEFKLAWKFNVVTKYNKYANDGKGGYIDIIKESKARFKTNNKKQNETIEDLLSQKKLTYLIPYVNLFTISKYTSDEEKLEIVSESLKMLVNGKTFVIDHCKHYDREEVLYLMQGIGNRQLTETVMSELEAAGCFDEEPEYGYDDNMSDDYEKELYERYGNYEKDSFGENYLESDYFEENDEEMSDDDEDYLD